MQVERKLKQLGLSLPPPEVPTANYVPLVRTGNIVFLAGHVGDTENGWGKLGLEVTVEQGYEAAKKAVLNSLATLKENLGDLDKIKRVVKLMCMFNCLPSFADHSKVADGASNLIVALYGERGLHARTEAGMSGVDANNVIELEMIVEVADH